jgi:hypothetical protein
MSISSESRGKPAFSVTGLGLVFVVLAVLTSQDLLNYLWPGHRLLWFAVILVSTSLVVHFATIKPERRNLKRVLLINGALIACYGVLTHFIYK